ncbi:MAG TPA: bifunctional aspartate kinase/homoserine dehydrogenase I [Vicinamibacterales bacterium]|nr:bifunctional aspartate kinase/homoserine dehydrogenase I [Vicinamibacterales bacterium]
MKVLKFGGSSLATPARVGDVARIVLEAARRDRLIVVVSAFQGITDQLLACARMAERGDRGYERARDRIAARHIAAIDALLGVRGTRRVRAQVDALLRELHDVLHGTRLLGHAPPRALDLTASFGERLSACIVAAYVARFRPARAVDARGFLTTDDRFTGAMVNFARTNPAIRRYFARLFRRSARVIPIVTGFIGATADGRTTTIGRNGSDYTAAILGAAAGASAIEIWTDVDGVLSADPKAVSSAFVLPQITYEEALELSYFGAKVLHSATIAPAIAKGVPIVIKNTFNPAAPGTLISRRAGDADRLAKGISSVGDLTLLTLRGLNMVGVPGVAERLFRALAARGVNVILISQASSEHTICLAVSRADATAATEAVRQEFRYELQHGLTALDERPDQAIIAVVGDGMKGRPGVAGRIFGALGRHSINISAIAQGASERNVSCVIDAAAQARALNVIHEAFFETRKRLALVVVGVGTIGSALLRQLHQQHAHLLRQGFDVRVVGVANSKRFALAAHGINLAQWQGTLAASPHRMDPRALARAVALLELTNVALVDCTAASAVVDAYPDFVNANLHIVTPNKRANVLPWRRYAALLELLRARQKRFLYEANVGAGLPVMSTLRDLIDSGDAVTKVEGIFSGTLSYLFNAFDGRTPFSALVARAYEMKLTEPDPREDLSGEDVARKLLILARQIGSEMDIRDVRVESLVPRRLARGRFSRRFFASFSGEDGQMSARVARAAGRGSVLRYVGRLEHGRARAGIAEFPRDHPIAATKGTDNIIAFTTTRYAHTPLVIQGPGAGADVTAMGVFSDILKLLHYLH